MEEKEKLKSSRRGGGRKPPVPPVDNDTPDNEYSNADGGGMNDDGGLDDGFQDEMGEIQQPLSEPTIDRDYSKPEIDYSLKEDIGEPTFQPLDYDDLDDGGDTGKGSGGKEDDDKDEIGNPALNDADTKDKRLGAKMAVEEVLSMYKLAHKGGAHLAKISDGKMQKLYAEDKISPDVAVRTANGNIAFGDMINDYNASCDDIIAYDEEFGEKVRKPMERIFMKRGIGLTDEQFVGLEFAKDIVAKGALIYSVKSNMNRQIDSFCLAYEAQKDEIKKHARQAAAAASAEKERAAQAAKSAAKAKDADNTEDTEYVEVE